MADAASRFRWRSFVTSAILFSFLAAAVSGLALFARPEGSLARWTGWSLLGADKRQWESLHIASILLFLVLSPFHVWYNWRPLVAALSASRRTWAEGGRLFRLRPELAAALALVGLMVLGSVANSRPFSAVNDLRASVKDGRFAVQTPPPGVDADRLSVDEVCSRMALAPAQAVANARSQGIAIGDTSKTLGRIAQEAGVSPEAVFEALKGERDARP